ncbi:MAG: putative acetyltransferase [Patiriisocius sp.]|jgi:predicted acetyltransferase
MTYRDYNSRTDVKAVRRIWLECGWIDDLETEGTFVSEFFEGAEDALVATIDNEAECAVHSTNGTLRYQTESLSMGAVTGVTTSRVARKLGFARELTAQMLARQVAAGHEVSALGMFEQGFYDKVGFGTGSYEQLVKFDPSTLQVDCAFRPPKRLTVKDSEAMYYAMQNRKRGHGGVTVDSKVLFKAEMNLTDNGFGLGYYDGPGGTLSHFIWGSSKGEHGPFEITFRAYQSIEQLFELLALIKSLGDQINLIETLEFGDIQLQDLLKQPFRQRRATANSRFANYSNSMAYWQVRVLDLNACLAKTRLDSPTIRFNLDLDDPVATSLPAESNWQGCGGQYVVQLGESSSAEPGIDTSLPTLKASINAFSRLWLGVRPATQLAATTDLQADPSLLAILDRTIRLPRPHLGWDF